YVVVVSPPRVFPIELDLPPSVPFVWADGGNGISTSPPIGLYLYYFFKLTRLSIAWWGYATERG
ncbi:MAG: hypothetical protein EBS19_10695, partial [Spirochaetia bacterium]|nr:hypothetical protein [Spirochaetia bacterium]